MFVYSYVCNPISPQFNFPQLTVTRNPIQPLTFIFISYTKIIECVSCFIQISTDNTCITYSSSNYNELKSPKPPRKLHYTGSGNASNCNDKNTNAKYDYTYYGVDDACRSPKITYSSSHQDDNMSTSGNGAEARNYYEERSPKYLYDQSPRKSPKSPRHFVFDAVSPRAETTGK